MDAFPIANYGAPGPSVFLGIVHLLKDSSDDEKQDPWTWSTINILKRLCVKNVADKEGRHHSLCLIGN